MPVIREKQQFAIQPIGVARASSAGVTLGQAISNSANQLNEIAFKRAAENAEKAGVDQAKSFDSTKLTGINPETGAPVALDNITSMGRIQAEAYERIIDRRFEESIENEMMLKSKELAMRHSNPSTYESLMSDYIGEMSKGAEGPYSEYINNTGSVWLSKTKLVLQDNAIREAKAAQKRAEAEANARRATLAYQLGYNGDVDGFNELSGMAIEAGQDLATFTNDSSAVSTNQRELAVEFTSAFASTTLAKLTSASDRINLREAIQFGTQTELSAEAARAYNIIRNTLGNNASSMVELGKSLSDEITFLNAKPTKAETERVQLSQTFGVENRFLTQQIEDKSYFNLALGNFEGAYADLERYSTAELYAANYGNDEWNKRVASVGNAEDQILSAGILTLIDGSNPSQEQLENIKNGIKTGNLEPLFLASGSTPQSTKSVLTQLLAKADPKDALSAIESMATWQGGVEQRKVVAANTYHDVNMDRLNAEILDGTKPFEDAVAEYEAGASSSNKFEEGMVILKDTQAIQSLRSVLSEIGITEELIKEVQNLASGTDISSESTPELNARGLRDEVSGLLQNISDVDRRKASVSSMKEVMPKDQAIAAKAIEVERFDAQVDEISKRNLIRTPDGIVENRDNLIREINNSSLLDADEKAKYISEINLNTSLDLFSSFLGDLSPADQAEAIIYLQNPEGQSGLTEEVQQQLKNAMSPFATVSDRFQIISRVNGIIDNIKASKDAREKANIDSGIMSAVNGSGVIPYSDDPKKVAMIDKSILQEFGLTAAPPDMFTNIRELSSAADDPSNPRHNEGLYTLKTLDLASRGVVSPQLETFLRAGLRGGSYGGLPVNINEFGEVLSFIGGNQDITSAERIRSDIFSNSGFSMEEAGVLEGIIGARLLGVPSEYMSKVVEGLNNARITDDAFDAQTGESLASFVLNSSDTWFSFGKFTKDINLQKDLISYARGLFISGKTSEQIDGIIGNFVEQAFYKDNFSVNPSSLSQNNVRVGIERTFSDDKQRTAALHLYQVGEYARIGAEEFPNLSPREQIEQGSIVYRRENKWLMTGSNFATMASGEIGKKKIVFAPRFGDTNMNAVYTPYIQNTYGDLEMIPNGTKISSNDPNISLLASQLSQLDLSGNRADLVIENQAINFYLNRGK